MSRNSTVNNNLQKMSNSEENIRKHILNRPDTYGGSFEKTEPEPMWLVNSNSGKMCQKQLSYVPALLKVFDDILVNAADNKWRVPPVTKICVEINKEICQISIWNDGKTLPVITQDSQQNYIPSLVFGGFDCDIDIDRVFDKKDGYGSRLANVFSTEFEVQIWDNKNQIKFSQNFHTNMSCVQPPKIQNCSDTDDACWTKITFIPDLSRFLPNQNELDEDHFRLMKKRVYDIAGILGGDVEVFFNGEKVQVKSFQEYVKMYLTQEEMEFMICEEINPRCQVCVVASRRGFADVSFVNNFCTYRGGTHLDSVKQQLQNAIQNKLNQNNLLSENTENIINNNLWVFISCFVDNPAFDSQDKQILVTHVDKFQDTLNFTQNFIDKLLNSEIYSLIFLESQLCIDAGQKLSDVVTGGQN
eukprot:TRINITY_DN2753_c0_g1_i2.p1 TRINITY_DN2753_c0_g1~~TRINITY_DN2753_c0_g1_i2.p1  ORF type:complete len:415 (-),score=43.34 TRINITY_DN2753_c0_g1_i2:302-1546(-)